MHYFDETTYKYLLCLSIFLGFILGIILNKYDPNTTTKEKFKNVFKNINPNQYTVKTMNVLLKKYEEQEIEKLRKKLKDM